MDTSIFQSSAQHRGKNADVLNPGLIIVTPQPRVKPKPENSPAHSATSVFPEHFGTGSSSTMRKGEIMASLELGKYKQEAAASMSSWQCVTFWLLCLGDQKANYQVFPNILNWRQFSRKNLPLSNLNLL